MVVIRTESLCKTYGKGENKVIALDNINIDITSGEFVAIIGSSGSGKSTLLNQLGGIDKPTSGKVFINNENIYRLKEKSLAIFRRRNIGFIFQSFNLVPVLNVEENIKVPVLLDGKKVDENYFMDLVKTLKLENKLSNLPSELSGGQMQRVAIARALINKPSIILADEPTGNLDSEMSEEIISMLKMTVKKYNQTILMITHDNKIAAEADRVIRIKDGRIV